jgi:MoaA/NifB/PqqE/SkfB family radical SAM enzyme
MMKIPNRPTDIIWDVTYACPLRCAHCYSESGRRASRQLSRDNMLRVADALISLEPMRVALAGGEPLLVRSIFEVAERMSRAGIEVALYTEGWVFEPGEKTSVCPCTVTSQLVAANLHSVVLQQADQGSLLRGRPP